MTVTPLAAISFIMNALAVLWTLTALILILIILIQKGKGGGLGGMLGGGMAGGLLGSKTGDFLTWVTISLVSVFLLLSVILAKFLKPTVIQPETPQTNAAPVEQPQPEQPAQPITTELPDTQPEVPAETNTPGS